MPRGGARPPDRGGRSAGPRLPGERSRLSAAAAPVPAPRDWSDDPVLVDSDWLAEHLGDEDLVVLEVDEQPLLYRLGHVPGAHALDWHSDLQDPVRRDIPDAEAIERLWRRVGIGPGVRVVLYGDKNNWYACFAYWLFSLYGLRDQRVLDGGRPLWIARDLPLTRDEPPEGIGRPRPPQFDGAMRAGWWDVMAAARRGARLVDVRTPAEYTGQLLTEPNYPAEAAQRAGHIPGALSIPWSTATQEDGRFKPRAELAELYGAHGVRPDSPVITYCRIGERSAHTWFVLHELLGYPEVRNYDGSWTEWGSLVGTPVALGAEPGAIDDLALAPLGLRPPFRA